MSALPIEATADRRSPAPIRQRAGATANWRRGSGLAESQHSRLLMRPRSRYKPDGEARYMAGDDGSAEVWNPAVGSTQLFAVVVFVAAHLHVHEAVKVAADMPEIGRA